MIRRVRVSRVLVAALLALGACSDGSPSKRTCPPKGLGVEEFEGFSIVQQIEEYREYNCPQPQICPDIGAPTSQLYVVVPKCEVSGDCPAPAQVNRTLTNCSTGSQNLVLDKIVIYGDSRCSFTEAQSEDNATSIAPGESLTIKTDWTPKDTGQDHGQFRVYSNAQNFNELKLTFCGRALLQGDLRPPGADAGVVSRDAAQVVEAGATVQPLQCNPSTTVNQQCHSEN